jgi:hypothetical protein
VKRENRRRNIMHPMFVTLFIQTDADDLLSEEHERKHHAHAARRGRSARVVRAAAARAAITDQCPVLDVLAEDPDISEYLGRTALGDLLDPRHSVGLSASMADRVLARNNRCT